MTDERIENADATKSGIFVENNNSDFSNAEIDSQSKMNTSFEDKESASKSTPDIASENDATGESSVSEALDRLAQELVLLSQSGSESKPEDDNNSENARGAVSTGGPNEEINEKSATLESENLKTPTQLESDTGETPDTAQSLDVSKSLPTATTEIYNAQEMEQMVTLDPNEETECKQVVQTRSGMSMSEEKILELTDSEKKESDRNEIMNDQAMETDQGASSMNDFTVMDPVQLEPENSSVAVDTVTENIQDVMPDSESFMSVDTEMLHVSPKPKSRNVADFEMADNTQVSVMESVPVDNCSGIKIIDLGNGQTEILIPNNGSTYTELQPLGSGEMTYDSMVPVSMPDQSFGGEFLVNVDGDDQYIDYENYWEDQGNYDGEVETNTANETEEAMKKLKPIIIDVAGSDQKQYKCPTCEEVFSRPSQIYAHFFRLGHAGRPQLKCEVCNSVFGKKSHLAEHIKARHEGVGKRSKSTEERSKSTGERSKSTEENNVGDKEDSKRSPLKGSASPRAKEISTKAKLSPKNKTLTDGKQGQTKQNARVCRMCKKTFSDQSELWKHLETDHMVTSVKAVKKVYKPTPSRREIRKGECMPKKESTPQRTLKRPARYDNDDDSQSEQDIKKEKKERKTSKKEVASKTVKQKHTPKKSKFGSQTGGKRRASKISDDDWTDSLDSEMSEIESEARSARVKKKPSWLENMDSLDSEISETEKESRSSRIIKKPSRFIEDSERTSARIQRAASNLQAKRVVEKLKKKLGGGIKFKQPPPKKTVKQTIHTRKRGASDVKQNTQVKNEKRQKTVHIKKQRFGVSSKLADVTEKQQLTVKITKGLSKYTCKKCKYTTNTKTLMFFHMRQHQGKRRCLKHCQLCGAKFLYRISMLQHELSCRYSRPKVHVRRLTNRELNRWTSTKLPSNLSIERRTSKSDPNAPLSPEKIQSFLGKLKNITKSVDFIKPTPLPLKQRHIVKASEAQKVPTSKLKPSPYLFSTKQKDSAQYTKNSKAPSSPKEYMYQKHQSSVDWSKKMGKKVQNQRGSSSKNSNYDDDDSDLEIIEEKKNSPKKKVPQGVPKNKPKTAPTPSTKTSFTKEVIPEPEIVKPKGQLVKMKKELFKQLKESSGEVRVTLKKGANGQLQMVVLNENDKNPGDLSGPQYRIASIEAADGKSSTQKPGSLIIKPVEQGTQNAAKPVKPKHNETEVSNLVKESVLKQSALKSIPNISVVQSTGKQKEQTPVKMPKSTLYISASKTPGSGPSSSTPAGTRTPASLSQIAYPQSMVSKTGQSLMASAPQRSTARKQTLVSKSVISEPTPIAMHLNQGAVTPQSGKPKQGNLNTPESEHKPRSEVVSSSGRKIKRSSKYDSDEDWDPSKDEDRPKKSKQKTHKTPVKKRKMGPKSKTVDPVNIVSFTSTTENLLGTVSSSEPRSLLPKQVVVKQKKRGRPSKSAQVYNSEVQNAVDSILIDSALDVGAETVIGGEEAYPNLSAGDPTQTLLNGKQTDSIQTEVIQTEIVPTPEPNQWIQTQIGGQKVVVVYSDPQAIPQTTQVVNKDTWFEEASNASNMTDIDKLIRGLSGQ